MNCPKHPDQVLKPLRLDVYGCPECGREWLIHKLNKPYEESRHLNIGIRRIRETNEAKET